MYLAGWKPYENPITNRLQIFNEFCAASLFSFFLGYASAEIEGPTRFMMGTFCIAIVLLLLVVNFVANVIRLWRDILLRAERYLNLFVTLPL